MLHYTIVFLFVTIVAAALGFGGMGGPSENVARVCFFVFLALAIASVFAGRRVRMRRQK